MSCTGPTLYPVVLSSIDGECVFAEYDLSTAVNVTNWQNIHDVVMWCCPWLYFDKPDSTTVPGPMPKGVMKPNADDPANTDIVWVAGEGGIGNSNFPQGQGYVDHSYQFTQLAGGADGAGTAAYWEEVNPSHEALFYLELGNEVETSAAPAKITMGVSSVSGGSGGYRLGIDPTQTVSYSGTDGTVANWGTEGSSKWSYKFQSANNRSLESLVNIKSSATSAATTGQVFTFNGTRWQASAAPTGGGEIPSFSLSAATDSDINADNNPVEPKQLLVYLNNKWTNATSVQVAVNPAVQNASMSIPIRAAQTSAVFTASNTAGDEVFAMKGDGSFKVSGTVSAAIVSATEGTFLTVTGIDHGGLGGLGDDDHPQYVLSATNNALSSAYTNHAASASVHFTEGSIDHGSIGGLGDDDHPQYVLSATNNALSSAYTNHAASASVHFTEGSIDHGSIGGLGDDDHTQYHNDTRGDTRYYQKSEFNSDGGGEEGAAGSPIKMDDSGYIDGSFIQESDIDHGGLGGLGDDDHTQYHNDTRGDVRYNLKTDLASTVNSKGASLVGIEDAGAYTSVTDVEAAIQEIYPTIPTSTWSRYISYAEQPITWNGSTSYYSNPGVSNATNKQRATAGLNMTNSNERGHVFQIIVPPELDVTAVITATVYARTGAAGSGNIEIEWSGGAQTDNEYMGTGATTTGAVIKDVSSYGNNDSIQIALGTVWNADTLVEGDILHMTIFRDATVGNGDDTFAATLQYMGIELTGTRKAAF